MTSRGTTTTISGVCVGEYLQIGSGRICIGSLVQGFGFGLSFGLGSALGPAFAETAGDMAVAAADDEPDVDVAEEAHFWWWRRM